MDKIKRAPCQRELEDAQKLADYLPKIFSSDIFKSLIGADIKENKNIYSTIGGWTMAYAIATRDFSEDGLVSLLKQFEDKPQLLRERGFASYDFYRKMALEQIALVLKEQVLQEKNVEKLNNLSIMEEILIKMQENCSNNGFYTHSFSGALVEGIEGQGLDISQELFKEELEVLKPLGKSVWKSGSLCLTPASETTFSFAMNNAPERILAGILNDGGAVQRLDGETNYDYFVRRLEKRFDTQRSVLPSDEVELAKLRDSALRICEFYGTAQKSGIAIIPNGVFRDRFEPTKFKMPAVVLTGAPLYDENKSKEEFGIDEQLFRRIKEFRNKEVRGSAELDVRELFDEASAAAQSNGKGKQWSTVVEKEFFDVMGVLLDNEGDGFGLEVEGGKIPREHFAISAVPCVSHLTCAKSYEQRQMDR